jgi:hypothetical protein
MSQQYLRKYKVQVVNKDDVALDVSNLRCAFRIEKIGIQAINFAIIQIFNLNDETALGIIDEGMRVIVQAGYENGPFGVIFDGDIFQPIYDRVNVVDYVLTLHCIDGDSILNDNFVGFTTNAGSETRDDLINMLKHSEKSIPAGTITEDFETRKLPRGKTFFGEPKKYIRQAAQGNNSEWCISDGQLDFSKITEVSESEALVLSPDTGLIGVPEQTPEGVHFRCLLNPSIVIKKPPMSIKLSMSLIRQRKRELGQLQTRLDNDGLYKVATVIHSGDTRGNDWYTEVFGVNLVGTIPVIASIR